MPIHEFRCQDCEHVFEKLVFPGDPDDPQCPQCQSANVQKLISAGSFRPQGVPKGSGGFSAPSCKPSG